VSGGIERGVTAAGPPAVRVAVRRPDVQVYTQLSIFLENEPGTLKRLLEAFAERGINIIANSVDNSVDCAIYRCVVTDPVQAVHLLESAGTFVLENEVLGVTVDDTPGSLGRVASA